MNTQQDSQSSMLSPSPPNQADEPHKDSEPHLSCLSRRPYVAHVTHVGARTATYRKRPRNKDPR